MEILETRSNHVFAKIINPQQEIATNLTGWLPVTSNRRNKYLFIPYKFDKNSILVLPMNNRTDKEFIHVFKYLYGKLNTRGLNTNYMQLNNEALPAFQALIKDNCID